MAHTCNPSYSERRDKKDRGSKPAQANSSVRPYLKKNPSHKRVNGMALSSSSSTAKKKKLLHSKGNSKCSKK
jgi:hypothetical protein